MRLILFLALVVVLDWYLFNALRWLYKSQKGLWKSFAACFYWLLTFLFCGFLLYNRFTLDNHIQNSPLIVVQSFFLIFYFSKGLFLMVLIIDEFRRLISYFRKKAETSDSDKPTDRSLLMTKLAVLAGIVPFFTLLYGKLWNAYWYRTFRIDLPIPNLSDALEGFKIVQISDIHTGSFFFDKPLKRAIEIINEQKPDIVFFTGDLVNERTEEAFPFKEILKSIKAPYGIYSVLGNHDFGDYYGYWADEQAMADNLEAMVNLHKELGWQLLRNENQMLEVGPSRLAILGVDNISAYDHFPSHGDLSKAYRGSENADLRILLSHDPTHWDKEVNNSFPDIALTLSGHTHGSQFGIEIPGWLKWSPVRLIYKQWGGLYQKGKQFIYVNRGLGFIGYAGRIGILPEITVLTLKRSKQSNN